MSLIVREGQTFRRVKTVKMQAAVEPAARAAQIARSAMRGLPSIPIVPAHDRTMVLAGYGPSLAGKVDDIAGEEGDLFTVSGAHDYLLARDVVPMAHIEADPREHKAKLLSRPDRRVVYMLASCCHDAMFNVLDGMEVYLWHCAGSSEEDAAVRAKDPAAFLVCGGTTVISRAKSLGSVLGYRRFVLYGFDACFAEDGQHAGAHPNTAPEADCMTVRIAGREFKTSAQMFRAAQDFLWQVSEMRDCEFIIHGDGMIAHVVNEMRLPRCTVVA